ncbi:acyl-CoA N-acyltransferase [Colletotrichum sublineola]|uniref:Putative acetyltransferase n=1 Tax=Colletotrichum sublineola TaxID=1173701 RepID=A0A066X829_COLSU|nr:acyl-CoA N-acyltransferase [Colletotrichum sublineola]KDN63824.1 putative acetyltransferase [Colletotrichum sublineola]
MANHDADSKPAQVSLSPVQADDVPALLRVHTAAFKTDQFSNLMLLNRDEDAHQEVMTKSIRRWMSDPGAKLTRALDADGRLVGWSCWIVKAGYEEEPAPVREPVTDAEAGQAKHGDPEVQREQDPARVLGGLMFRDMTSWEDNHLSGKTYMVLQALATDPRYQRQGIATRLVQHGIEEADSQRLPCWIHASPASHHLYVKAGFEEVGKSDYDLDEWAPGGKGGNRGWGRYTFRYMLRPAKNVV